jgi:hypothetical protein
MRAEDMGGVDTVQARENASVSAKDTMKITGEGEFTDVLRLLHNSYYMPIGLDFGIFDLLNTHAHTLCWFRKKPSTEDKPIHNAIFPVQMPIDRYKVCQ